MSIEEKPVLNKFNCLKKLWGDRESFSDCDMCDVLGGFEGSEMLSDQYGVLDKIHDFIWVRDKLQDIGVEIDDTALAQLMFK